MKGKQICLNDLVDVVWSEFELYCGYDDTTYLGTCTNDKYPEEYGDCPVSAVSVQDGKLEICIVMVD